MSQNNHLEQARPLHLCCAALQNGTTEVDTAYEKIAYSYKHRLKIRTLEMNLIGVHYHYMHNHKTCKSNLTVDLKSLGIYMFNT